MGQCCKPAKTGGDEHVTSFVEQQKFGQQDLSESGNSELFTADEMSEYSERGHEVDSEYEDESPQTSPPSVGITKATPAVPDLQPRRPQRSGLYRRVF